ncbi:hypothetical protein LguiB_004663 [Lonicera macranthoides]
MAQEAVVNDAAANSCCSVWIEKYSKLQQRYAKLDDARTALRRGIEIFEQQLAKMQTENQNLKKAYEEERVRAENEREEKMKESGMRADLEDEISDLKSEILSLQQKGGSGVEDVHEEVTLLKARVSEGEAETSRLKDLLEKERKRADSQKKKAEAEVKKTNEAYQNAKAEKSRADKEREDKLKESAKRISLEKEISSLKTQILSLQEKESLGNQEVDEEITLLRARISEGEAETSRLKDLLEKERMQADSQKKKAEAEEKKTDEACQNAKAEKSRADKEREEKLKESAKRISLEKEISSLKSEILLLQQKEGSGKQEADEEITSFRARMSEWEAETSRLKDLLEKERMQSDSEKKKAEAEEKKTNEACQNAKVEKIRADKEREEKLKESAKRISLEKEISSLKSQILSLQKKEGSGKQEVDEEITLLRAQISQGEAEISRFKQLLDEERMRADYEKKKAETEKKKAEAEKKKANEAWEILKAEKGRADEERRLASIEGKKAEENRLQLERLKAEVDEAQLKLVLETAKSEEAKKKFAAEREKAIKEKKRADAEMAKAEEQRKLAEINRMKSMEEKSCAEHLSQQLEEEKWRIERLQKQIVELVSSRQTVEARADLTVKQMNAGTEKVKDGLQLKMLKRQTGESRLSLECLKSEEAKKGLEEARQKAKHKKKLADSEMSKAEEQRKVAEAFREKAKEEKNRADQLAQQLKDHKQRIEELQKEIQEHVSSRRLVEPPVVPLDENINAENARMKLLRKQLKFERMQVKHAKEVAKLEQGRNSLLQHELCRLKQEFLQFSDRLKILDSCFSHGEVGIDLAKTGNVSNIQSSNLKRKLLETELYHTRLHSENELLNTSGCLKEIIEFGAPLLPTLGGNCTESISGIDSKLEPLLRGSNRKMLQSSAVNSSLASFSDRPLVGSQERGTVSVTESARLAGEKSNPQPNISTFPGEVTKLTRNENLAVVAENSVRSPLRIGKKRKRILDAVEFIEHLYSEGKKWHLQLSEDLAVLHDMLGGTKMEKTLNEGRSLVTSQRANFSAKQDKSRKKRRSCNEKEEALCHLHKSSEQNDENGSKGIEEANVYLHASTLAEACKGGVGDSGQDDLGNFEVTGDYMKLLDLDNSDDERRYRLAIAMPLSPSLPEIEFQSIDKYETDNSKQQAVGCFNEGSSNANHCGVDVMNLETESNKCKLKTYGTTHVSPLQKEGSVDSFEVMVNDENGKLAPVTAGNACVSQTCKAGAELGMSNCGDKVPKISCKSNLGSGCSHLPQYCIVFSHPIDCSSVSKVFCATRTCLAQCPLISEKDWVVPRIMITLLKVEDLLPKEKVCVFFSLLLHNFSRVALEKFRNFSDCDFTILDSFAGHMLTVMSDVETRNMFAELCNLDELLDLIENFLIDRRVLIHSDQSSESLLESDPIANIALNGEDTILSVERASTNQLVAGASIVASLCAAIDCIGFICEASYNIIRMQEIDTPLLTVLHVFAYICGSKYFTHDDYRSIMTVIKSLITFLEGANLSANSGSVLPSLALVQPNFPPCTDCPFFEGAVFMEIVVSMLLEKLQNYGLSGISQAEKTESRYLLNSEALSHKDETEPSSSQTLFGKSTSWSNIFLDVSLCELGDILSLLELVACKMSWDWAYNNIVHQMLKMLESCPLENLLAAIIIFLGHLGRLGAENKGYEDTGVKNIRDRLSEFLYESTSRQNGLAIQVATVTALLGVIPRNFEEIIKKSNLELSALVVSHSVPPAADCISGWFSLLNKEQQSLSMSLLSAVAPG